MGDTEEYLTDRMVKRVKKEILKCNINCEFIENKFLHIPVTLTESLMKTTERVNKRPLLRISLKDYPWKVPKVHYRSMNISKIYRCGPFLGDILREITNRECLCCESFLCEANWVPGYKIIDIINEFLQITEIKTRLVERVYCNKIQDQLIVSETLGRLPLEHLKISDYL